MKLVFITNLIHHHQVPVADEFYRLLGDGYCYISTKDLTEELRKIGYADFSHKSYLLEAHKSEENRIKALKLINEADVVIIGGISDDSFIQERLKHKKIIFRYSERWLKNYYNFLDYPRKFLQLNLQSNKNVYYLAAGAFVASDLKYLFAFKHRCYKWGYFTSVQELNIETILAKKRDQKVKLMCCSRFLKWKHLELAIKLAKRLKDNHIDFEMNLFGDGNELNANIELAKKLGVLEYVNFKGAMPNNDILLEMQQHNIFLFASDRREGWGAVVNEAMSSGCAVVASNQVGSVPFLIKQNKNGLIFKSGSVDSLYSSVITLINNRDFCESLAIEAYTTMREVWSPANAAKQFLKLANSKLNNTELDITSGPCSIATTAISED